MLDPEKLTNSEIRLHMGEITDKDCRTVRAAIRWANSVRMDEAPFPHITPAFRARLAARRAKDHAGKSDTMAALYAIADCLGDLAEALDKEADDAEDSR